MLLNHYNLEIGLLSAADHSPESNVSSCRDNPYSSAVDANAVSPIGKIKITEFDPSYPTHLFWERIHRGARVPTAPSLRCAPATG